ncbi:alanine racemase [Echinicola pacifica]|uniref:Alanine racemase n=1 Tax=Echinicola pacifica TaxID=346377 RepID=A0A918PZ30_9BACT|nr:alanine racemase [Echinicola pacifica]GGZ26193.1 alanine racemase [Echinicola pacifica]
MILPYPIITAPTLFLDEKKALNNLKKMSEKAKKSHTRLVPHFKTHQSRHIGEWYKEYGVTEITVSSIYAAEYFLPQLWENIHIAFPFNPLEITKLNRLAAEQSISVQLVNAATAGLLADNLLQQVGYFIEIDAGYGRTGVEVSDFGTIEAILRTSLKTNKLKFRGFYIHAGHTYHSSPEEIQAIYHQTTSALTMLKDKYNSEFPDLVIRLGDTPSCSIQQDFAGIDEVGPGNFIFYDLTQAALGSCTKEDIAVALAAPIVDIKKHKNEILVHGGGVHLSKDVLILPNGQKSYGEVVFIHEDGWEILEEPAIVKSISQEHGVLQAPKAIIDRVHLGELIGILPVHSCMTADCMGGYMNLKGEKVDHFKGQNSFYRNL